jgi:hypothetical protein
MRYRRNASAPYLPITKPGSCVYVCIFMLLQARVLVWMCVCVCACTHEHYGRWLTGSISFYHVYIGAAKHITYQTTVRVDRNFVKG